MKIALFSDVHANLPALTTMFESLDKHQPDAVYCLGDLVGYNVWPNEVIAEIRKRSITVIAGNHDLKPINFPPLSTEELANTSADYAYHILGAEERNYLQTLPAHVCLTYQINNKKFNMLMVHGSPNSVNEYVLEDSDEHFVLNMMDEAKADILCVGHSHLPYQRVLKNSNGELKLVINTGSVGKPKDNNPQGCYVLIHIDKNSSPKNKETLPNTEFIRFDYDVQKAADAILNSPLPNELAHRLVYGY